MSARVCGAAAPGGGAWADATVNPEMPSEIENAVLSRARDLRLRAVEQN